jgi:hypothetical protein
VRTTLPYATHEQFVSIEQHGDLLLNFRALNADGVSLGLLCQFGVPELHVNLDGLHPGVHSVEIEVYTAGGAPFSRMDLARVSVTMDNVERYVIDLTDLGGRSYLHHLGHFYRPCATSFDWAFQPSLARLCNCSERCSLLEHHHRPALITRKLPDRCTNATALVRFDDMPAHAIAD